ncbi:MAG: class I SAM-dependent methyltransferase [Ginsengibacter sp.]
MKKFLSEILIDPSLVKSLIYDETQNVLHTDEHENIYEIIEEVPVILSSKIGASVTSPLHQKLKTNFNYSEHYQKDAEVYNYFKEEENAATRNEIRRLHEAIINAVPQDSRLILDVGCGNGWLANYFLKKNRQVISMDISTVNPVRVLKENPHPNHAALVADVYNNPIKNNSIDCIVAAEIMEHVHDPGLFIDRLLEKLKPGGKLVITTPYNEKLEYYLCIHCNLPTPKNAHLHTFNEQNIKAIIPDKAGNWRMKCFANKYLIKSRLNLVVSFLPFKVWKIIDALANAVFPSSTRFIIEIIKK